MTELWNYIEKVIMPRWPGLSMRRMSQKAGLAGNTVGKIKGGNIPKAETLLALADRWGRSDEERQQDYREMMERAGKMMPETFDISEEEKGWVRAWRDLNPQQRQMAQMFFHASSLDETLEILARGLQPPSPTRPTPTEAFQEFLDLLRQVSDLSPEECMVVIADALRRVQEKGRPDYSLPDSEEQLPVPS